MSRKSLSPRAAAVVLMLLLLALLASANSVWAAASRGPVRRTAASSTRAQVATVQDPAPAEEEPELVLEEPAEVYEMSPGMPYVPLYFMPLYFRGEQLSWWVKGAELPPLVTTGSVSATPTTAEREQAGVLGQAGTRVLFGDSTLEDDLHMGQRYTLGLWLDPSRLHGIEGAYFRLGSEATDFSANQTTNSVLARPFLNVESGLQDAELVAFPNVASGRIDIAYSTELEGAEVLYRRALTADYGTRWDFLCGYRYARLQDRLTITESLKSLSASSGVAVGTTIDLSDLFDAENSFHGGELGVTAHRQWYRCALDTWLKVALGGTTSRVHIDGRTTTTVPTTGVSPVTTGNGLLAQPTNMGTFESSAFSAIPELGAALSWSLTPRLRATVGYSFMYWSNVARAGSQIDPQLNLSQLPPDTLVGAARPEFNLSSTGVWVQGINAGLDFRF